MTALRDLLTLLVDAAAELARDDAEALGPIGPMVLLGALGLLGLVLACLPVVLHG